MNILSVGCGSARSETAGGPRLNREFTFKKTAQLSPQEKEQFLSLFARTFPKALGRDEFGRKYSTTPLGHSFHGLMLVDGALAGAYNLIPYAYSYFGERRLFGLSVDTMVTPEQRGGPFNLVKMAALACDAARRAGVSLVFGFPNDKAYPFTKRLLKWSDIGELDYYALPISIGAIRPRLRWANSVSRLSAGAFVHLPRWGQASELDVSIEKVQDQRFAEHRYHHEHHVLDLGCDGRCVYRTCREDNGIRTTYIIDVTPLTAACFARAVRAVHDAVARQTDLLLYVGRLPFSPAGLLKVPAAQRPRRIRMCGKILERRLVNERALNIEHWNVNISNFDVR